MRPAKSDQGSIMPLALGFVTIAVALIMLAAVVSDIYLAHRKLFALADSAALAAADSFELDYDGAPGIVLEQDAAADAAAEYVAEVPQGKNFDTIDVHTATVDGTSVSITLRARFEPVLLSPFVPDGITLTSTATARGALRQ